MHFTPTAFVIAAVVSAVDCVELNPSQLRGAFDLLTYNIAGLPHNPLNGIIPPAVAFNQTIEILNDLTATGHPENSVGVIGTRLGSFHIVNVQEGMHTRRAMHAHQRAHLHRL